MMQKYLLSKLETVLEKVLAKHILKLKQDIDGKVDETVQILDRTVDGIVHRHNMFSLEYQNSLYWRHNAENLLVGKMLFHLWRQQKSRLSFDDIGYAIFSQNNEDGILNYIYSQIGFGSRKSVEIGVNTDNSLLTIPEGNSIYFILSHAFHGMFLEFNETSIGQVRHFFSKNLSTKHYHWMEAKQPDTDSSPYYSPLCIKQKVTPDNINGLLKKYRFGGEIDLLSIDVDGEDYAIWNALEVSRPRVVVVEFNGRMPADTFQSNGRIIGDDAEFDAISYEQTLKNGCSLKALCDLGKEKGYRFVGVNNCFINAFFVREDICPETLPAQNPSQYTKRSLFTNLDL